MKSELLAQKINEVIIEWAKDAPKLVVAIDGYTGIGKTTLLNNLAALNPDVIPVNRDDFLLPRKTVAEKLAKANDRSAIFELEVCNNKKLEDFINTFRNSCEPYIVDTYNGVSGEVNVPKTYDFSKKNMVVEGVFMFHPQLPPSKLWDKRIYLEGNIKDIDERRVRREQEKWGKDYFPETHPDSYFRHVTTGLKRYIKSYRPDKLADFTIRV